MARFTFKLVNPKSDKETPINLVVNYSCKRVVFYTREHIKPKLWNFDNHRAKITRAFPEHPEFNSRLDKLEETAKNIFRCFQNDNDHAEPSPTELKNLLNAEIRGAKNSIPRNFFDFANYFIEKTRKNLRTEKKQNVLGNIAGSYQQTLLCIRDFAKDKILRVDFDTIDSDFYNDFVKYLETLKKVTNAKGKEINKYGFTANTIGKHIKNLKRILNEATEIGVNKYQYYKSFKVLEEETDSIYLDEKELQALYELELPPRLDRVRDLFLVGCWTGLRFSDFTKIKDKDIQGDYIHIKTQKTGERVVIPVHRTVKAIMSKYSDYPNSLPPDISNVNMNLYLKEIGGLLTILHVKIDTSKTKAGMKVMNKKAKYELLTTHTARRSFATNMYKDGVPTISIMKVTGHKTEKAFLSYIKVTPDEHAKILMGYFQKQVKLKVV